MPPPQRSDGGTVFSEPLQERAAQGFPTRGTTSPVTGSPRAHATANEQLEHRDLGLKRNRS